MDSSRRIRRMGGVPVRGPGRARRRSTSRALGAEQERALARSIRALEEEVRAGLREVPAAAALLRDGGTRTDQLARVGAALAVAGRAPDADPLAVDELRRRWAQAEELRWSLALSATRVVRHEAHRLASVPGASETDLVQEGWIGLLDAAARFDADRGIRFSTYARWWVRAAMTRAIEYGRTVRLPSGLAEQLRNLRKQIRQLEGGSTRWSLADAARAVGLSPERAAILLDGALVSLDPHDADDQPLDLVDGGVAPDEVAATLQVGGRVSEALRTRLTDGERLIMGRRFGLDGEEPLSYARIAGQLGVPRERIQKVVRDALSVLREASEGA